MSVKHLNQGQLAERWGVSEATLERWRSEGIGPVFLKLQGRVAYRIEDIEAYRQKLMGFVYHSGQLMRPLFAQAKKAPKRVIYADGEDERVLRAVQTVADEKLAFPILIGRPAVIEMRIQKAGLRLIAGQHFEIVDPEDDSRFNETWNAYYQLKGREGVTPAIAKAMIRKHNTLIGAMLLRRGDARNPCPRGQAPAPTAAFVK